MRPFAFGVLIACLVGMGLIPLACRIGTDGLGPVEDASAPDADVFTPQEAASAETSAIDVVAEPPPSPPPSCGNCGGACCGDQCVVRYCPDCDAGAILCPYSLSSQGSNGYCIGSCSMCAPNGTPAPVTCYTCGSGITLGSCGASTGDCPQTASAGACPCPSQDAGECPGETQVCMMVDGRPICITP